MSLRTFLMWLGLPATALAVLLKDEVGPVAAILITFAAVGLAALIFTRMSGRGR